MTINKTETKAYDLKEFVLEYLSENEEFTRENKLQISLKAEMGNRMKMDKGAFKRIIDNLLTNSIRYRKKESSSIQITIIRKPATVFWSIKDDGPGVAKEDLEKIFESFCRLDEARTHCSEGSGLGLAIVKRIVLDHQGIIYARSREGLEICMEFPAAIKKPGYRTEEISRQKPAP